VRDVDEAQVYSQLLNRPVETGELLEEDPCVSPPILAACRDELGQPCPRVQLVPENIPAAHLLGLLAAGGAKARLAPLYFAAAYESATQDERVNALLRVAAALETVPSGGNLPGGSDGG
jgi:hypothetical protein